MPHPSPNSRLTSHPPLPKRALKARNSTHTSSPPPPPPRTLSSNISADRLESLLLLHKNHLLPSVLNKGLLTAHEIRYGATIPLKHPLPHTESPTPPFTAVHGELFTDTIASWVKQGFVAGPFLSPPFPNSRFNSLMAIEQKNKVRVIMNLSAPAGASLNDAIDNLALEKVSMSTAFGHSVIDCGPSARMWKWDLVDAHKNIPAAVADLRLQAFSRLGMGFVKLRKSSATLPRSQPSTGSVTPWRPSRPPSAAFPPTSFTVPSTTHQSSSRHFALGPGFCQSLSEVFDTVGARLAPVCPDHDKAFEDSNEGTVLGVRFHTKTLS
jgi:hypothetical protein